MSDSVTIYRLIDPRSGLAFYVGKTVTKGQQRLRTHICDARAMRRCSSGPVIRDILADQLHPRMEVLEVVPRAEWRAAERRWVMHYLDLGLKLTNRTLGGEAMCAAVRTEEWKRKVVESGIQSGRRAEGAERAAQKNRGRKQSPEEKAKRSALMKGRRPSDATIAASVAATKGKPLSPERRAQCGVWRGKKQSVEHGNKKRASMLKHQAAVAEQQKTRWSDPEYRAKSVASMKGRRLSSSHKERLVEAQRLAWSDPTQREARIALLRTTSSMPEALAKNSEAVKAKWADPVWRAAMLAARAKRNPD